MPEGPEEQLEFLRREDIRTMAKDMARLREEEAKKERERIIQLQEKHKKQQDQPSAAPESLGHSPTGEPSQVPLMPSGVALRASPSGLEAMPTDRQAIKRELPKPQSRAKKIFVRVVIVFLVLFITVNAIALIYFLRK